MSLTRHQPVLVETAVEILRVRRRGVYLDATVGGAGYAVAVLEAGAGLLIGLDWDEEALSRAADRLARFGDRARLVRAGFQEAGEVLAQMGLGGVDGLSVVPRFDPTDGEPEPVQPNTRRDVSYLHHSAPFPVPPAWRRPDGTRSWQSTED